jgi:hypothetical protein
VNAPSSERAALVLIANDRLPCEKCGKPHDYRPEGGGVRWTWAHPDDGHQYRPITPQQFARDTLASTSESDDCGSTGDSTEADAS